eukprot:SAG22_NODE_130_length_18670_cov_12.091379_20_plen_53_part_00
MGYQTNGAHAISRHHLLLKLQAGLLDTAQLAQQHSGHIFAPHHIFARKSGSW